MTPVTTPWWTTVWNAILAALQDWWSHGWPVLLAIFWIIVFTIVARWVLLLIVRRVIDQIVSGVKGRNNVTQTTQLLTSPLAEARVVQRTRTIGSVLTNLITWVLVFIAGIAILGQLSVNLTPLIASAGIIGAALGFGAQSLVKDFLTGIFMVFEDQLGVGDIVDLGTVSGVVESVGLRVTSVRSTDGTLWYVRNGEILKVGNMSHDWGRAIVELPISSHDDFDAVEQVMLTAAHDLAKDPKWARRVIGEPELWGIDAMDGNRLVLRVAMKTKPSQQFDVARELRARTLKLLARFHVSLAPDQTVYNVTAAAPGTRRRRSATAPTDANTAADPKDEP